MPGTPLCPARLGAPGLQWEAAWCSSGAPGLDKAAQSPGTPARAGGPIPDFSLYQKGTWLGFFFFVGWDTLNLK